MANHILVQIANILTVTNFCPGLHKKYTSSSSEMEKILENIHPSQACIDEAAAVAAAEGGICKSDGGLEGTKRRPGKRLEIC